MEYYVGRKVQLKVRFYCTDVCLHYKREPFNTVQGNIASYFVNHT